VPTFLKGSPGRSKDDPSRLSIFLDCVPGNRMLLRLFLYLFFDFDESNSVDLATMLEMRMSTLEALDRTTMLCWLLKDFGWMTNNAYLGIPFGVMSMWLHIMILMYDRRQSMVWLNSSLMAWLVGNFMWMVSEFIFTRPSLYVHLGPGLPLGGLPEEDEQKFLTAATSMFAVGIFIQLMYYSGIACGTLRQPGEEGPDADDVMTQNDIEKLCSTGPNPTYTSAFLENMYVIFWIMKDLLWSLGTGSIGGISGRNPNGREVVIFFESIAIVSAVGSFLAFFTAAYLSRRNGTRFLDAVSGLCWITANAVWMCGEFFLRYDNLELDDGDQGNDLDGRIGSTFFFSVGIIIQLSIIMRLVYLRCCGINDRCSTDIRVHSSTFSPLGQGESTNRYGQPMHVYSPQKMQDSDDLDFETVMF
jgi:hypothetical protein